MLRKAMRGAYEATWPARKRAGNRRYKARKLDKVAWFIVLIGHSGNERRRS